MFWGAPVFASYMPKLIKLIFLGGAIHQIHFLFRSPLPFGMAQTQDAGMLFYSTMACGIAATLMQEEDITFSTIMTTVLFCMSLSSVLVGIGLIGMAHYQLANIVQYLPIPVLGGYLGFIGMFCVQNAVVLMTGLDISSYRDWWKMLDSHALLLLTPGLLIGLVLTVIRRNVTHVLAFPCAIMVIPLCFYFVLLMTGYSFEDAREHGWLNEPTPQDALPFWDVWSEVKPSEIRYDVLPAQFGTFMGLFLVTAFTSTLDFAALEMATNTPLDINEGLKLYGWTDVICGCLGGYTGSYTFSLTTIAWVSGIQTRICGATVAVCQLLIFASPFSITCYVPLFFFGAVLAFIGFNLMYEWLLLSTGRFLIREYCIIIGTFLVIAVTNVQQGMLGGVVFAAVNFIYSYAAKGSYAEITAVGSGVVRNFNERNWLAATGQIVRVELHGYLFFGSSYIADNILNFVVLDPQRRPQDPQGLNVSLWEAIPPASPMIPVISEAAEHRKSYKRYLARNSLSSVSPQPQAHSQVFGKKVKSMNNMSHPDNYHKHNHNHADGNGMDEYTGNDFTAHPFSSPSNRHSRHNSFSKTTSLSTSAGANAIAQLPPTSSGKTTNRHPHQHQHQRTLSGSSTPDRLPTLNLPASQSRSRSNSRQQQDYICAYDTPTRFLVLDCHRLMGMDSTAARSTFTYLKRSLAQHGVVLVFSRLPADCEWTLRKQEILSEEDDKCLCIPHIKDAIEFCEDKLLSEFGGPSSPAIHDSPSFGAMAEQHTTIPTINLNQSTKAPQKLVPLCDILNEYLRHESSVVPPFTQADEQYFKPIIVKPGDHIFREGEFASRIYIIQRGTVTLYTPGQKDKCSRKKRYNQVDANGGFIRQRIGRIGSGDGELKDVVQDNRIIKVTAGAIIGETHFHLKRRYTFSARVESEVRANGDAVYPCTVYSIDASGFKKLTKERPELAVGLLMCIVKNLAISVCVDRDL